MFWTESYWPRCFYLLLSAVLEAFVKDRKEVDDDNWAAYDEHKALYVLQHWDEMPEYGYKLVPEHVEVRSLHNPENPGLMQVRDACIHTRVPLYSET